jgi:hypothetical protein
VFREIREIKVFREFKVSKVVLEIVVVLDMSLAHLHQILILVMEILHIIIHQYLPLLKFILII